MSLLKNGVHSLEVVLLQLRLRNKGYYKGLINGYYDANTYSAVTRYQGQNGLYVDGLAGNKTNSHLEERTKNAFLVLFLHCTATREHLNVTAKRVADYHLSKWSRTGYSDVCELDGNLVNVREWDQDNKIEHSEYTFGVKTATLLNPYSRHFCYVGGVDTNGKTKDTRTKRQRKTMETYIKFNLLRAPNIIIAGHNQVQKKGCPSFDVPNYLKAIGVHDYNIAHWEGLSI